ncbi:hypothetical protein LZ30DRAFT_691230 [Colletotrichum cereale]|nr:hypothetical protein LZ30DRAFT_691230 [Colletotrichum cereale]
MVILCRLVLFMLLLLLLLLRLIPLPFYPIYLSCAPFTAFWGSLEYVSRDPCCQSGTAWATGRRPTTPPAGSAALRHFGTSLPLSSAPNPSNARGKQARRNEQGPHFPYLATRHPDPKIPLPSRPLRPGLRPNRSFRPTRLTFAPSTRAPNTHQSYPSESPNLPIQRKHASPALLPPFDPLTTPTTSTTTSNIVVAVAKPRVDSHSASTSLTSAMSQPVTTSAFLESITSGISRHNVPPPPEPRPVKQKVVKKVRVLSPPPSSPSSSESVHSRGFGRQDDSSDDGSQDDDDLHFSKRFPELPGGLPEAAPLRIANASGTPDNPFGKSLQDLEGMAAAAEKASPAAAGKPMDVNSFKMLLLTGQAGAGTPPPQKSQPQPDLTAGFPTDAYYAAPELDTPRTSQDIADRRADDQRSLLPSPTAAKRKPPPPSSRHGRKISVQTPERPHISSETASPVSPSDVNKPLPPAPSGHGPDDAEDVFAREAAGKVPELDSPTPNATPTPAPVATGKKPTPAPPPRRGHARSQSLTPSAGAVTPSTANYEADTPPRSSMESQRSRSESFRSINAPAPPPPRRPHASHRQSHQLVSPSNASFNATSPAPSDVENPLNAAGNTPPKISPPPPPPARNTSTRRPPSVRSIEAPSRKASIGKENTAPPPPPPPRQRGSSRGSMDGYGMRRTSIDSTRAMGSNVPEEPVAEESAQDHGPADSGMAADILADLDALQREVDALRASQGK